ncbi:triphosphoribosyl-dephospho-CoA synthase [Pseudalkalibacillus hwajinpoensis]|uniref:triphosphoribosyl-dephospho-CoA synthase n=1 Tax=Guptibacillus hwajinpoensis TaxID=208199 RepID=UPI00325A8850
MDDKTIANVAVESLIEEAELTPKPGLVDRLDNGAHDDLDLPLMIKSATSLRGTFREMARVTHLQDPTQSMREEIAKIGRQGELVMLQATNGTNTHKGAIWALGLLVASTSALGQDATDRGMAATAGKIARFSDRHAPGGNSNGNRVMKKYGVPGARGEAEQGFPHVVNIGLPVLRKGREQGVSETHARLNALIALIASLDDTCILHRGGAKALLDAKKKAGIIVKHGGVSTKNGWRSLQKLNQSLLGYNASPGGSADLLAATLFLDKVEQLNRKKSGMRSMIPTY